MSKNEQRRQSAFARGMKDRRNAEKNMKEYGRSLEDEKWAVKPHKKYALGGVWNAGWARQSSLIRAGA